MHKYSSAHDLVKNEPIESCFSTHLFNSLHRKTSLFFVNKSVEDIIWIYCLYKCKQNLYKSSTKCRSFCQSEKSFQVLVEREQNLQNYRQRRCHRRRWRNEEPKGGVWETGVHCSISSPKKIFTYLCLKELSHN